jgi:GT2 family glycosyltransferase
VDVNVKPHLLIKLAALWHAGMRSIERARSQGLGLEAILRKALRALATDPRGFGRKVMAFDRAGPVLPRPVDTAGEGHSSEYETWLAARSRASIVNERTPLISVVMPTCETPEQFLIEAIASVQAQSYPNWELCIHDDASRSLPLRRLLESASAGQPRIRVSYGQVRQGIAAATNSALELASGEIVAFLDHDDVLHVDALGAIAAEFGSSEADIVYTDHDILDEAGRHKGPYFKPDWSLDLFLSQMYLGHLVGVRRRLVEQVGGLRSECDGAQDYDLVLRCLSAGARVSHVPEVLYHWRQHAGSTSANASSKPYAHHAGRRALQDFVDRQYPGARVDDGEHTFCYDVRYPLPSKTTCASIIIPTRDRLDLLEVCIRTLRSTADSASYEILVVDNGSEEPATLDWLAAAEASGELRVVRAAIPFNWSALNNIAAEEARGDVLIFLNNDTEFDRPGWLERLSEVALRRDVGACGPLLLYPDGTIQHAGVVVGMGGWADHVFKGQSPVHHQHLFTSPAMRRNVLAVTGACMAIEASKFRKLGGFDESFVVCGSDVELCLRAHAAGYLNVYVAEARLIHHESKSRDPRAIPENDFVRSAQAYGPYRDNGDPFYSPNLDPMSCTPSLRSLT